MWYVIQVLTGHEEAMTQLISRVAPAGLVRECFTPRYATERKHRGGWVPCTRTLLPGYLIADTDRAEELDRLLAGLPEFARVLAVGEHYVPLDEEEREFIGAFTHKGERVVPMSMAVKDGDRVTVTSGPLLGREAIIERIDRRSSTAYLKFEMCGRSVSTRVGLGVVSAQRAAQMASGQVCAHA